jgi:hypothetical protein
MDTTKACVPGVYLGDYESEPCEAFGVVGKEVTDYGWKRFERKLSEQDKKILESLKEWIHKLSSRESEDLKEDSGLFLSIASVYYEKRRDSKFSSSVGLERIDYVEASTSSKTAKSSKASKTSKPKTSKISGGMSKEAIRTKQSTQKFNTEIQEMLSKSRAERLGIPVFKPSDSIEKLILSMIFHINEICGNVSKLESKFVLESCVGCSKFYEKISTLTVKNIEDGRIGKISEINSLILDDLKFKLDMLMELSKFSILTVSSTYPKLLVNTNYDSILPNSSFRPHESQIELIEQFMRCKNSGILTLLKTITGDGKTTMANTIGAILHKWNLESGSDKVESSSKKTWKLIYCCSQALITIANQVGQNAWNSSLPFGYIHQSENPDGSVKTNFVKNYNCMRFGYCLIHIADIASTYELLKKHEENLSVYSTLEMEFNNLDEQINQLKHQIQLIKKQLDDNEKIQRSSGFVSKTSMTSSFGSSGTSEMSKYLDVVSLTSQLDSMTRTHTDLLLEKTNLLKRLEKSRDLYNTNYVLFFDEPTVDLDSTTSPMIHYLAKIFSVMPAHTILSTATAPESEQIPMLREILLSKYPKAEFNVINSTKVKIGSEISDIEGNIYVPHSSCHDLTSLGSFIEKIQKDFFLQKCYTATVVNQMYLKLVELGKKYRWRINSKLDFAYVLSQPSKMNQDSICKLGIEYLKFIHSLSPSSEIITEFCSFASVKKSIDFSTLSSDSTQFESQTLIVTNDPNQFLIEHFGDYISKAQEKICKLNGFKPTSRTSQTYDIDFDEVYQLFQTKKRKYQDSIDSIQKTSERAERTKRDTKGIDGDTSEMSKADHDKLRSSRIEDLGDYPTMSIPANLVIGSSSYAKKRGKVSSLNQIIHEIIKWERVKASSLQKYALSLGIGIYSKKNHESFNNLVLSMASKTQLAYLIADDIICYGANYPFENIIVDNTWITPENHSVKTIFQVFSRAGRQGKSWRANIYADKSIISMISHYVNDPDYVDIEVINMNKALLESIKLMEDYKRISSVPIARPIRVPIPLPTLPASLPTTLPLTLTQVTSESGRVSEPVRVSFGTRRFMVKSRADEAVSWR